MLRYKTSDCVNSNYVDMGHLIIENVPYSRTINKKVLKKSNSLDTIKSKQKIKQDRRLKDKKRTKAINHERFNKIFDNNVINDELPDLNNIDTNIYQNNYFDNDDISFITCSSFNNDLVKDDDINKISSKYDNIYDGIYDDYDDSDLIMNDHQCHCIACQLYCESVDDFEGNYTD